MIKQTDLVWCQYSKDNQTRYHLLLYLGQHDGNVVALDTDLIPDNEIAKIRANIANLRVTNLRGIWQWVKQNLPTSFSRAYKHYKADKLKILKNYDVKELKTSTELKS